MTQIPDRRRDPRRSALGAVILQDPTDKPHGLREAYILCENGYAWVRSPARWLMHRPPISAPLTGQSVFGSALA